MSCVGLNALISSAHDRKHQEEPPGRDNPAPAPQSWAASGSFCGCGRWGRSFRQKNNMQVCTEAANSEKIKPGPHPEGHASNFKSQHREQVSEALGFTELFMRLERGWVGRGKGRTPSTPLTRPRGWGWRGGRRRLASCSATKGELGAGSGASQAW